MSHCADSGGNIEQDKSNNVINSSSFVLGDVKVSTNESVELQVKLELEHERRLRTQAALDDSEKRQVALKRELDLKSNQCQDLNRQLLHTKEKNEHAVKKVSQIVDQTQGGWLSADAQIKHGQMSIT